MDAVARELHKQMEAVVIRTKSATHDELVALAQSDSIAGLFAQKELNRRAEGATNG